MRTRVLGVLLVVLTVLGGLNLVKAIQGQFFGESHSEATVKERGVESAISIRASGKDVMIDKAFAVQAGQTLLIDVQHSDIEVRTGDVREAQIKVTLEARDMDRARELFERMEFEAFQDGDRIVLRSEQPNRMNWRNRMHIRVEAIVPVQFNADIQSTHGDVDLEELEGSVDVRSTHGDVTAESVRGEYISFHTTHGDLEGGTLRGRQVRLNTTHGDIDLAAVHSDDFEATTTHSDIEIDELDAPASLRTTHGDVRMRMLSTAAIDISTTHGDVDLYIPGSADADLDIRGSEVRIPSSAGFKGSLKKEMADGVIGNGGPRMSIATTHGEVTLYQG